MADVVVGAAPVGVRTEQVRRRSNARDQERDEFAEEILRLLGATTTYISTSFRRFHRLIFRRLHRLIFRRLLFRRLHYHPLLGWWTTLTYSGRRLHIFGRNCGSLGGRFGRRLVTQQ